MSDLKNSKTVFCVTAHGASANSFLVPHFRVLSDNGYKLVLLCRDDDEASLAVQSSGIRFLPIPIKSTISPFSDIKTVLSICFKVWKYRPDMIHAHMSKAGVVSMVAAYITNVRSRVYHNHGMACFSSNGFKKRLLESVEWLSCTLATDVLFCSESTKAEAVKSGLCNVKKAQVLGSGTISGVKTNVFSPARSAQASLQLIKDLAPVAGEKKFVSFVGRVVPHKGVDTLLKAWDIVSRETKSSYSLLIAGANEGDELFGRVNRQASLDDSVVYLGRIDNILGLYGASELLLLPSWHEGFPYSVLEAQSCGVPAIVTDVTGNRDAVIHNLTGLMTTVNDPREMANMIELLLSDNSRLLEMSQRARELVISKYDEQVVLANLLAFYRKAV